MKGGVSLLAGKSRILAARSWISFDYQLSRRWLLFSALGWDVDACLLLFFVWTLVRILSLLRAHAGGIRETCYLGILLIGRGNLLVTIFLVLGQFLWLGWGLDLWSRGLLLAWPRLLHLHFFVLLLNAFLKIDHHLLHLFFSLFDDLLLGEFLLLHFFLVYDLIFLLRHLILDLLKLFVDHLFLLIDFFIFLFLLLELFLPFTLMSWLRWFLWRSRFQVGFTILGDRIHKVLHNLEIDVAYQNFCGTGSLFLVLLKKNAS